jgi:Transposase DDE domain
LWVLKERLWQQVLRDVPHDPQLAILDSLPLPVCQFARAPYCRRFRGAAAYGKDQVVKQTFFGFRLHARLCWPGVLTRLCLAPANLADPDVAPVLTEGTQGVVVGDRLFWRPRLQEDLRQVGLLLLAPFLMASHDPWPRRSRLLSRVRYRIDTVFGQLVDRCAFKRLWARDLWHLGNRLLRLALMHTLAVFFNVQHGYPPLQLARLVA